MQKLDILITRFPFRSALGGEELHTLNLAESLKERGHDVTLLTADPILIGMFKEAKLDLLKAARVRPPVTFWTLMVFTLLCPVYFVYLNWFLFKFYRKHKKERRGLCPVIYCLSLPDKLLLSPVAKLLGFHVVWVEHARIGGWLTKNPWIAVYFLWARFSQIIAPSRQTARPIRWVAHINIIPHGIKFDKPDFTVKSLTNQHDKALKTAEKFNILCVARLSQDKGVDYSISAVLKLINHNQKVGLLIAGTGPLKESLEKMAKELHLDRYVKFVGKIAHDRLHKLYKQADVVILPSSEHDPFGLVVLEGMAMKKPVVITSVCGVSEYLTAGVEAMVVPPKDDHALYQAINALLINQKLRAEIAQKGYETLSTKFNYERMVDSYERVFLGSFKERN